MHHRVVLFTSEQPEVADVPIYAVAREDGTLFETVANATDEQIASLDHIAHTRTLASNYQEALSASVASLRGYAPSSDEDEDEDEDELGDVQRPDYALGMALAS